MEVNGESSVTRPARRTQAQRTAETRSRLIAAGRRLFAQQAFADVSTQAIVEAAGVTRGALYHQFTDKSALFEAVYEEVEQELMAEIAGHITAHEPSDQLAAMRAGARLFLERCAAPDIHQIALVNAPAVLGWQRWREIGARYGLGVIEALLTQAVADGAIPAQPVRPTAHMVLGALDEAALYISRAEDAERAREEMYAVCDRLIDGIAGRFAMPERS
ncbi:TetR family transcriptional regulator [Mycobacterium sp. IS-1496]|uniref:TetR/AcrR family transcriptional regulator n=1 Tax=Mycobacterium sp. IS-1496 TaxID=1772284 RepID=UPI0007417F4B|nr:TetR/AcrR family transcriptional regulator [Mycobacterium sp. IS-1496]KUI27776.1 TetR family transcriptional regulator [Mycobacterium sp. IS-1496]